MDQASADKLQGVLARLYAAHEELLRALQLQQQAIRRFDADQLDKLAPRCDRIAQCILELDQARVALIGPTGRLTDLAQGLAEPGRSRIVALATGLRGLAEQVASISRVNNTAIQNMLDHFHTLYRLIARSAKPAGYDAAGQAGQRGGAFLVDAVA